MLRQYVRRSIFSLWFVVLFALALAVWIDWMFFGVGSPFRRDATWGTFAFRLLVPGVLAAIGLGALGLALRHTLWPDSHPAVRGLGEHGPVEAVRAAIEAELADVARVRVLSPQPASRSLLRHLERGDILLTASWVVCRGQGNFDLCLVPLPLVASAERQYGPPQDEVVLGPAPLPFDGVLVRLLDGREIHVPTHPELADRLLVEIRLRSTNAQAFAEKWVPTRPRLGSEAQQITEGPSDKLVE